MRWKGPVVAVLGAAAAVIVIWFSLWGGTIIGTTAPPTRLGHPLLVATVDDALKQADPVTAASLIKVSHDAGFDAVLVSSMWEPGAKAPSAVERLALDNVVKGADAVGMRVFVFVWHGLSGNTPRTVAARRHFAAYTAALARAFPQIRDIVVGNEPNLNTFWLPQFGRGGSDVAATAYLDLLARTYDALKAVSPQIQVIGGALAPRGSDRPGLKRATHSPTRFIEDLGAAYKKSGRSRPIMDAFSMHPYMRTSELSPMDTHAASTTITIADYPKLAALLTHAFAGTRQRGRGLPIYYTEFGVQTRIPAEHRHAYRDLNSPSAADAVDPQTQARYYREALELAACQPTVKGFFVFHTFDEADLAGWQSGLYYADQKPKASLPDFRLAAASARAARLTRCTGSKVFVQKD
ncbi:MAG: hypothetical protein M3P15_07990 [Actinomycetota bacterium]|nr:hypothetical protein [Actinomycetota bacterium]